MKKIIITLSFILLLSFAVAFKSDTVNNFPLFGKSIIIDVGHGNLDPGSVFNDDYEKDYNLVFAVSLKKELERLGGSVVMTREGDYDLSNPSSTRRKKTDFDNRIKFIDERNPDLFISLHMNYLEDENYFGSQVFYSDNVNENRTIAELLQKKLNKFFNFSKEERLISDDKYMYKKLKTSGVLIEFGFISSYKDRKNLKNEEYRNSLANVIATGIIEYFNT